MMRVPDTGGFVAMVTLSCLLLFVGRMENSASAQQVEASASCKASYRLAGLENKTLYEEEYRNDTDKPRSILDIIGYHLNSSSREVIANNLTIQVGCLDYLDFMTRQQFSLIFMNTCQFKNITFEDVFARVFSPEMERILVRTFILELHLRRYDIIGNETLKELAMPNNTSLNETTVLQLLLAPLNHTDVKDLSGLLEINSTWFDLLNHTTSELAEILGVPEDDLKHYSYLTLIKSSFTSKDFFLKLKLKIREVRASLKRSWREITAELTNVTTVLDGVVAHVPERLRCLTSFIIDVKGRDLQLLNRTLPEFAELLNKTVVEFEGYTLGKLITFILKTRKTIDVINGETRLEIKKAVYKILMSYNVTFADLIKSFKLTEYIIHNLSPFKIEVLCARYTLIRYATNLQLTLTDVAVKLNKTEAELSYNLTVKEFHVVIRKLLIVRTFEVMSHMLGVSRHFLENSLDIHVPVSSLSMCKLDAFFNITRHTVLDLNEVLTQKTLAFVVQINGVSITFVYKLTIEQFITQIMHLDIHYFFKLNGLQYSTSRLRILLKYRFFELERLFHLHEDDGEIVVHRFSIFRHSLVWIINKIIYLVENDVDECRRRRDRCDHHSRCTNLPGSYECHCPVRGYRGRYCHDINECNEGLAICPKNAHCKNIPGSYECECGRGFRHNVTNNTCDDIDECASFSDNNCYWGNLQCTNTEGSYSCSCPDGYAYDPRFLICRDIDECRNDRDICSRIDENAKCRNRRPGFECNCENGFEAHYNHSVSLKVLVNCTDIDECARGHAVCPLNSECINTIGGAECRCFHGYEKKGGRCRAKRFIRILLVWVRVITFRRHNRVDIPSGFLYFGKVHKRVYIYQNGLISIGNHYHRSEPKRLKDLEKDVLAVFWANTDVTSSSRISYQVVDRSTPEFREQLDNTSDLLKNCSGLDEFKATWMLVVTWDRVSPYARFGSRRFNPYVGEQSTYQAVIITNGTSTYLIYSYEDGGMNWSRRLRRKCAVGYATKDKMHSYEEEDSFKEDIFHIDNKEFVNGIGEKKRGVLCMSLNTPDGPTVLTNEQKCMNWYNEEPDPDSWLEELSDCPASDRVARRDNSYRIVSSTGSRGSRVDCYERRFATRVYGASHQCCYYKSGRRNNAFISDAPQAGRSYRYHFSNRALRQKSDIEPFEACCSEGESTLCSLFDEKRPLTTAASAPPSNPPCSCRVLAGGCFFGRSCRPRPRPRRRFVIFRAWFFGDPHITSLDGCKYTFNGLGDYVMLRSKDKSLHVHAKTKRPLTAEGKLSNATVFSAFALKTNTSDGVTAVQISFDGLVPGNLSITVTRRNGSCQNYTIVDFDEGVAFTGLLIVRSTINNKTVIISLPSGFSVEVTPGKNLVQLSVSASAELMNNTEGLLGNFNGDKKDDLQYPNGTMISCNASEENIFELGQKWVVPHEDRMFVSSSCMLQNVSFDKTFVPAFLNLSAVSAEDRAICGTNSECLFDLSQTGDKELAGQSRGFEEENQAIQDEIANIPPEIKGPAEINVTLREKVMFYLQVSDANNDTVTLEVEDLPEGAMFNFTSEGNVGHFEWTPVNATNITLEFVATDSKNDTTVLPVIINMCRCENNGECDFTEFVGDNTGPFRVVGCNCSDGFEGTFCEIEVADACMDDPCYDNVTCNTTRNPFGFRCGPCPAGLTGDGENCFENDECANASLSGCNQTCVNTFGSFRCECNHGYISKEDGRICEEINECQDGANLQHNCTENAFCTNLPGSFNCTCNPGYEGDPNTNCTDIDECNNGEAKCSQGCRNTPGSFVCTCRDGFQLASNNETCEDINECQGSHNCERICDNRIGSYKCQCPPGFELNADNTTCKVAEGSACDATKGGCSDICVNRTGEITCYCNVGYNLTSNMKTCTDINECMTGSHGCSHKCSNNDGSFTCTCHAGYALAADKKTCQDVNECDTPVLNNCSQVCENNNGSFQCSCDDGFSLAPDNTSCTDINECGSVSPCSAGVCDNIPGSFQCTCPVGTSYSGGKCTKTRTFAVSLTLARVNGKVVEWDAQLLKQDSATFGVLARRVETQLNVFYRRTSNFSRSYVGCRVRNFRQGSVVADVDLNFNENATDVTPNTLNSELPQSGQIGNMTYDPQTAAISDFNECNDQSTHNCDRHAICINKPGTFECKCQDGYQGNGLTCDSAPEPADPEDDNKKERLAIIFGVLGGILALLILILLCFACRRKRYKAAFAGEDSNSPHNLTARSARSDVYFPEGGKDKEERTGSYEINPGPIYENPAPESRASGDYDYPDPFPGGTRQTAVYDNPGLQRESGPVKASHSDSAL